MDAPQDAGAIIGSRRRKRIQAGQAGCTKKSGRLAARFLRKEFSLKIGHLKSNRRRRRRCRGQLCNIRSTTGARASGASAMVTAERQRHQRVANTDTLDRAAVPEMPVLAGGGAPAARDIGKKRQVNHADALHDAVRRFGTDLAQWVPRGDCAFRRIVEMNCAVPLTLNPLPKRSSALQRPKV